MTIKRIQSKFYRAWEVLKEEINSEGKQSSGSSKHFITLDANCLNQRSLNEIRQMVLENPWVLSSEGVSVRLEGQKVIVHFKTIGANRATEVNQMLMRRL